MKQAILNFIQKKGLQIPLINPDSKEELICYIRFYIPNTKWEFYVYEIDENCDFANALVYSPYTHNIPDHGLVPLKDFVTQYTELFSNGVDFSLAKIDETFTPTALLTVINQYNLK